ncbi:MAG: lytic transglycosylase domain-containing protein [Clostridia bacterium]|nr:lytic transglycosylase domain-containing protein [Clostridia bacterium]
MYSSYVTKYSEEYGVDPLLVYAVIKAESNFDETVVSKSNAKGLMQLMDSTAYEVAKNTIPNTNFESEMLFDAETNINLGTKYLSELLKKYNRKLLYCSSCI